MTSQYGYNPFEDDSDINDEFFYLGSDTKRRKKAPVDPMNFLRGDTSALTKKSVVDPMDFLYPSGSTQKEKPLTTEETAVKTLGDSEPEDLNFWRGNTEYTDWLKTQNVDPKSLKGWEGSKLFTSFIKHKASDTGWLSKGLEQSLSYLGGMGSAIADEIEKVPIIGDVANKAGSVFKFIGNLFDVARSVSAGVVTSLISGHPEEIPDTVWQGLKYSLSSGTEGRFISWSDGALRSIVDDARKGMTEQGFKDYIDSDEYRVTKRQWQMGGLVLDLLLDPMWIAGAGATKSAKLTKALEFARADVARVAGAAIVGQSAVQTIRLPQAIRHFATKTNEWLDFMKGSKHLDQLGISVKELREVDKLGKRILKDINKGDDMLAQLAEKSHYADFTEGINSLLKTYGESLATNAGLYDRYLGSGLKVFKPFTQRKVLLGEVPIPFYRGVDKITDILKLDKAKVAKFLPNRTVERTAVRMFEDMQRAVRDAGRKADPHLKDIMANSAEAVDDIRNMLLAEGYKVKDVDVYELFMESVLHKAHGKMKIPSEFTPIMSETFRIGEVGTDGMSEVYNMSENFWKFEKQLMDNKAIKEVRKLWDDSTTNLLKKDIETANKVMDYYVRTGAAKIDKKAGTIKLLMTGHDTRTFKIASLIPKQWTDELFNYVYSQANPRFLEELKKMGNLTPGGERAALLRSSHRMNYTIKDVTDPKILSKFMNERHAQNWIEAVQNGKRTWENLWLDTHGKLRAVFEDPKKFGIVEDMIKKGEIKWQSPHFINKLSEAGLYARGITEPVYLIHPANMVKRVDQTYEMLGRLDALTGADQVGREMGFFKYYQKAGKKATIPKPDKYLGRHDWVQGEGLFSNYWVPEFLGKNIKALSEGISSVYNPIEAQMFGNIAKIPLLKAVAGYNAWWRPQVTLKNVAFHMRNYVTNAIMTFSEGRFNLFDDISLEARDLWHYGLWKSEEIANPNLFKKKGWGKKLEELEGKYKKKPIKISGEDYDLAEAYYKLSEYGVIGNAHVHDIIFQAKTKAGYSKGKAGEMMEGMDALYKKAGLGKWNLLGTTDYFTQKGAKLSSAFEEGWARIPLFLHHTRKNGMSMMEAAKRVNDIFIDYGSLTRGQKMLKTYLIPFFTWQYKMVGVMGKKMFTNPTMYTKVSQMQGNLGRMFETDKLLASQMDEEVEGIPMVTEGFFDKFIKGKPMSEIKTKFIAAERFIPQAVVNLIDVRKPIDFFNPESYINGIMKKVIENISPAVKYLVMENPLDLNIQTRAPFERFIGEKSELWGIPVSKKQKQVLTSLGGWIRVVDDTLNLFNENSYTGDKLHIVDFITKHGLGAKAYDKGEIREIDRLIRVLNDAYRGNTSSAKKKIHDKAAVKHHYEVALSAKFALDLMKFYREFAVELKDKELYNKEYLKD